MLLQGLADFRITLRHAIVAIFQKMHGAYGYVDKFYHKKTYQEAYQSIIIPFIHSSIDCEGGVIDPPEHQSRRGRPKGTRILSRGEIIPQKIRCGRFGQLENHNKKTCNMASKWSIFWWICFAF